MLLTAEQEEIVNSSLDSFKINAVAGSGKTTTLLEYAKKNSNLKILYLAYNKSLKIALNEKLKDYHLPNLHISTIHSLAYNKTEAYKYKLTPELKTNILEIIVNCLLKSKNSLPTFVVNLLSSTPFKKIFFEPFKV